MFHRISSIAVVLIVILSMVGVVSAQDEVEASCTAEQYQDAVQGIIDVLTEYKPQIAVESDALEIFIALESAVNSIRAGCTGVSYSSVDYPSGIIDPISFGGVLYQAEFTTTEFGSLSFVELDGDCGLEFITVTDMSGGSETDLWEFGGDCMTMFEVQGGGDWTLNIERLR